MAASAERRPRDPSWPGTAAAGLGLLIAAGSVAPVALAVEPLQPFTAHYEVRHDSTLLGRTKQRLRTGDNGEYILEAETTPAGWLSVIRRDHVIERSEWRYVNDRPRPQRYEYRHTGRRDERHVVLEFDWDNDSVVNIINDDPWRMDVPADAQDKLLYQYTMMLDMQRGERDLVYAVADGGELKQYRFELLGEEILDTPAGRLRTLKLQRDHADRRILVWCAVDYGYLPVRLEQHRDRRMVSVTATAIDRD